MMDEQSVEAAAARTAANLNRLLRKLEVNQVTDDEWLDRRRRVWRLLNIQRRYVRRKT